MTYGIFDEENHKFYTYMSDVFKGMDNAQLNYNWLITDSECYPIDEESRRMFYQEYCWLSGDELSAIVQKEDFQWIWGCLCGFPKELSLEDVLRYPLPSAQYYNGYYQNPVSVQHPLSIVEIVAFDSSWTLIISKEKAVIDSYMKNYPKCKDLFACNEHRSL